MHFSESIAAKWLKIKQRFIFIRSSNSNIFPDQNFVFFSAYLSFQIGSINLFGFCFGLDDMVFSHCVMLLNGVDVEPFELDHGFNMTLQCVQFTEPIDNINTDKC